MFLSNYKKHWSQSGSKLWIWQCFGSGSTLILLSWIRIENVDPIAGQYAGLVRDQRYRTEPWCRIETDDHRKKCRCRTFFPALRHLLITADVFWFSSSLDCSARSYDAPYLLHCTLELRSILIRCTVTELPCTLLSFTASFFELLCTLWATLHHLSYAASHGAAPAFYWAHSTQPTELHCTLLSYDEACCLAMMLPSPTLLSYAVPFWNTLHLTDPRGTLLPYAAPYWATLQIWVSSVSNIRLHIEDT